MKQIVKSCSGTKRDDDFVLLYFAVIWLGSGDENTHEVPTSNYTALRYILK